MSEMIPQYDSQLLSLLNRPAELLATHFQRNMGARIGESTVVSQKMHTYNPAKPEEITILQSSDAGQAFYQRVSSGDVVHLDIFHQCGMVNHRHIAAKVKEAVEQYNFQNTLWQMKVPPETLAMVKADMIDVQTGSGGGRLTGSLSFGRKLSLRRAHENHVHIAAMLTKDQLACLFFIVMAVENVILEHKLELRRNELIIHQSGDGAPTDLSPYSDHSDSFLKDQTAKNQLPSEAKQRQCIEDVDELADIFDTVQDIQEFLTKVEQETKAKKSFFHRRPELDQTALERLVGLGIVTADGKNLSLTEYGREFKVYLDRHQPEMEAQIRRAFRLITPAARKPGRCKAVHQSVGGARGRRLTTADEISGERREIDVAETVNAAARRSVTDNCSEVIIGDSDLRHCIRQKRNRAAVCLVVDASASMVGQRLKAAKHLVRHLLLATPDKVSIIVFQQEFAKVQLPFTRDYRLAEASLRQITAAGSTPLALGLRTCCRYLQEAGQRNPSIILITDGVPTVGDLSRDPMADSLEAAREIKTRGYGFTCFGLKPYRQYLVQLAETAGGTVCVMDELEKRKLVEQAWYQRAITN